MKSNDERPSSRDAFTPFEEELVNAMNDFANREDAPDFTPSAVMHGTRHRSRPLITAGVAGLFIVVGGGTALAVTAGHPGGGTLQDRPVSSTSHCTGSPTPVPLHRGSSPTAAPSPVPLADSARPTPVPLRPAGDCGPSSASRPTPVPRHAETTMAPTPASSPVPVPVHGTATPVPLAPAASPVPVSGRSGATTAPSSISSPTPAASHAGATAAPSASPTKR